ncbi:unnamed protein product [Sympodiomycopsis kandeliae]
MKGGENREDCESRVRSKTCVAKNRHIPERVVKESTDARTQEERKKTRTQEARTQEGSTKDKHNRKMSFSSGASSQVDLAPLLAELEADRALSEEIRTNAKEVEGVQRQIQAGLNRVHSTPAESVPSLVLSLAPLFAELRSKIADVVRSVPDGAFWKFNDLWTFTLQRSNYTVALAYYLGTGRLISKSESLEILGLSTTSPSKLTLTTEEYLHSLISVINDFSRLAVNSVTMNDYVTPLRLSHFVKDLSSGFSLLNLKNDSLRKRFDSIKYDVKKIEEVVYDISLRGLNQPTQQQDAGKLGLGVLVSEEQRQKVWNVLTGQTSAEAIDRELEAKRQKMQTDE